MLILWLVSDDERNAREREKLLAMTKKSQKEKSL